MTIQETFRARVGLNFLASVTRRIAAGRLPGRKDR
jgi:hypothetical protein